MAEPLAPNHHGVRSADAAHPCQPGPAPTFRTCSGQGTKVQTIKVKGGRQMARNMIRATRLEDEGVREARRVADLAAAAWRQHIGPVTPCARCLVITSRRTRVELCPVGVRLRDERDEAAEALRQERVEAARPNPDQGALFGLVAVTGLGVVHEPARCGGCGDAADPDGPAGPLDMTDDGQFHDGCRSAAVDGGPR
jgi:hypothetical protein